MARSKGRTICFIDDDPAELERFESAFGDEFNIITADSYGHAESKLKEAGRRSPDLWVLDLYFPKQGTTTSEEHLHEMSARFAAFDSARREFQSFLHGIDQGREGGLECLRQCMKDHNAPVVMFTRKGDHR